MKNHLKLFLLALLALVSASGASAQGTAFTYQGRLFTGTNPANGNYDFRFQVWNDPVAGAIVGGPVTNSPVLVTNGLFTVIIDFGAGVFTGPPLWLHIGVRSNGTAVAFTSLVPRQQLTPTPYAITAENLDGTVLGGSLSGTYPNPVTFNNPANVFCGDGSTLVNLNASALATGTVADARLSPNVALLNKSQTFTGANIFDRGSGGPGRLIVAGSSLVDTTPFTGLGFQYYGGSGEGAIMSSYNNGFDGYGFLTFYTKAGPGHIPTEAMAIDYYGNVAVDQENLNNGFINNGTNAGAGLTFGTGSGEGIASKRTATGNQYGLDFYTSFANRMSIANDGSLFLNNNTLFLRGLADGTPADRDYGIKYVNSLAGIYIDGPLIYSFNGGALGGETTNTNPDVVSLKWDYLGNVWINNNLSVGSLNMRGEFLEVNGLGNEQAYMGGDGFGNDVQFGSLNPNIMNVAFYNATSNAYMHIFCSSITINGGADLAEPFQISSTQAEVPQGSVVVIDEDNPGHLKVSDRAYDTRVAGVVSGANGVNPGIQMQQQALLEGGKNVALTGRVYVQADASFGQIKPGDLLTTSDTPGHAMKVANHGQAQGAILGKAMTGLKQGRGMVLVLVTLQ